MPHCSTQGLEQLDSGVLGGGPGTHRPRTPRDGSVWAEARGSSWHTRPGQHPGFGAEAAAVRSGQRVWGLQCATGRCLPPTCPEKLGSVIFWNRVSPGFQPATWGSPRVWHLGVLISSQVATEGASRIPGGMLPPPAVGPLVPPALLEVSPGCPCLPRLTCLPERPAPGLLLSPGGREKAQQRTKSTPLNSQRTTQPLRWQWTDAHAHRPFLLLPPSIIHTSPADI